ncbi:uncharacterized protein K452DRAFT_297315 [Aplosporella prunicola CBS 121167]|uniref:Uncharacterized protein n=1 Tax=Aplosporella prunicola CBS 121167 TaxID=1176127 RepID=A0A6A6BF45_9PEZI|nr:uncharacterized protein K452DRAFT_297315 [Aplosporella prunicola CBS 121167]KAF2142782.1 hypothetical protein K452DRAFT_297315 [Aplosporella prunicola CBS 121167]
MPPHGFYRHSLSDSIYPTPPSHRFFDVEGFVLGQFRLLIFEPIIINEAYMLLVFFFFKTFDFCYGLLEFNLMVIWLATIQDNRSLVTLPLWQEEVLASILKFVGATLLIVLCRVWRGTGWWPEAEIPEFRSSFDPEEQWKKRPKSGFGAVKWFLCSTMVEIPTLVTFFAWCFQLLGSQSISYAMLFLVLLHSTIWYAAILVFRNHQEFTWNWKARTRYSILCGGWNVRWRPTPRGSSTEAIPEEKRMNNSKWS